jgi:excisionase family DNA binding protein
MPALKTDLLRARDGAATVRQACEFIGCSRDTFYTLIDDGRLQTAKVLGRRLVLWSELHRFAGLEIQPSSNVSRLHSVASAALWLSVGRDSVYRLIDEGSLSAIRLRSRYRITEKHLLQLMADAAMQ